MKTRAKTRTVSFGICLTAALLLVSLIAFPKSGEAIPITGTGVLGSFLGDLRLNINEDTGETQLVVTLTNTSSTGQGGYLTGFALNLPENISAALVENPTYSGFLQLGGTGGGTGSGNAVESAPYGQFDVGAALGGDFEGGGKPKGGIAVGETATFAFSLSGDLNGLTAETLLSLLSDGTGAGEGYQPFVARFRGFKVDDDGPDSDKVPISVPEPGTLILLGAGLLSVGIFGIRKFRGRT